MRSIPDADRQVVAHVVEHGTVTNRTVQNLFVMTVRPANAIIDDLVRREVLVNTSVQQRGRGAGEPELVAIARVHAAPQPLDPFAWLDGLLTKACARLHGAPTGVRASSGRTYSSSS